MGPDYGMWACVVPYLSAQEVVTLRRVHRAANHPFPRDEVAIASFVGWNKSGKERYGKVTTFQLPLPERVEKDGPLYVQHVDPLYSNTRLSLGSYSFKNFSKHAYAWGATEATRLNRLQEYLEIGLCIIDRIGHVHWHYVDWTVAHSRYWPVLPWTQQKAVARLVLDLALPEKNGSGDCILMGLVLGCEGACIRELVHAPKNSWYPPPGKSWGDWRADLRARLIAL